MSQVLGVLAQGQVTPTLEAVAVSYLFLSSPLLPALQLVVHLLSSPLAASSSLLSHLAKGGFAMATGFDFLAFVILFCLCN